MESTSANQGGRTRQIVSLCVGVFPSHAYIIVRARCRWGDGTPFTEAETTLLRDLFRKHSVSVAWEPGTVLVMDNFRVAHARHAYSGPRKVMTMLAGPTLRKGLGLVRAN